MNSTPKNSEGNADSAFLKPITLVLDLPPSTALSFALLVDEAIMLKANYYGNPMELKEMVRMKAVAHMVFAQLTDEFKDRIRDAKFLPTYGAHPEINCIFKMRTLEEEQPVPQKYLVFEWGPENTREVGMIYVDGYVYPPATGDGHPAAICRYDKIKTWRYAQGMDL